jgi:hypothetical protein
MKDFRSTPFGGVRAGGFGFELGPRALALAVGFALVRTVAGVLGALVLLLHGM